MLFLLWESYKISISYGPKAEKKVEVDKMQKKRQNKIICSDILLSKQELNDYHFQTFSDIFDQTERYRAALYPSRSLFLYLIYL